MVDGICSEIVKRLEKEHKLFEKYDGNTGEISNCEYDAPEMLGWTAAAYLYFNNIKD